MSKDERGAEGDREEKSSTRRKGVRRWKKKVKEGRLEKKETGAE